MTDRQLSRGWIVAALVVLTALAALFRFQTLRFALPFAQEPDAHLLGQIEMLSQPEISERDMYFTSIYPHLIARVGLWTGAVDAPDAPQSLDEHLAAAGRLHGHMRAVIAAMSLLMIAATFSIAKRFVTPGWALFAAALVATSTLCLQFSQMARPHAAAGALVALAIAASLRLRERGDTTSFFLAGLATALALSCLQNAAAMLFAPLSAFFLRSNARWRWFDVRLVLPLGLIATAIWIFWPFLFVPTPPDVQATSVLETRTDHVPLIVLAFTALFGTAGTVGLVLHSLAEGPRKRPWFPIVALAIAACLAWTLRGRTIHMSWQTIDSSNFDGSGLVTVASTLWYYEPVTLALGLLGVAIWIVRLVRPSETTDGGRKRDFVVVASYALPYLLVLCMFRLVQQRFVIPLMPIFACVAAYGLQNAVARLGRVPARVLALGALAVPLLASVGYTKMRMRPQTLALLGEWIESEVDRDNERVALHLIWDVPLVRRHENLFDASGAKRKTAFSPWMRYQQDRLDAQWNGERWNLEALYPDRTRWPDIVKDPESYLRDLDADFVVLPAGEGVGVTPLTRALRAVLLRDGEKVLELPSETRPPASGLEGLDTPHFTYFVLTRHWFGPQLEVFRKRRVGDSK